MPKKKLVIISNNLFYFIVPDNCSDMFRYTIESLFITHAGTNLNTIGNVLNNDHHSDYYPLDNPWLIRDNGWCQGLLRRPQPQNITSIVLPRVTT
jgi:hypothetical protein